MLPIIALLLGLLSIGSFFLCILKNKQYDLLKKTKFQVIGWCACAFALFIPTLSQYMEFCEKDYDGLIDCISTYYLMSLFLLIIVLCLNLIFFLTNRNNSKSQVL